MKEEGTIEEMARIDKILEPEVNAYLKACDLSYAKYGDIFHAEEFRPPQR